MRDTKHMSDAELRSAAYRILADELGAVGFMRFLQQFDRGSGDYSTDRHELLKGETVDSILSRIEGEERGE